MALSGNLGFVPLDEVLRLLARSGQKGAVEVRGQDVRGRIFVTKKGITLATTFDDAALRSHLVNSGYVSTQDLGNVETGQSSFDNLADKEPGFISLLREMTVESLYQMSNRGASFEVDEDAETPYASPRPFDLEGALDDARHRFDEWVEVGKALADMKGTIRMQRDLGDRDEVTLSRDAWTLLTELGSGSSVSEMADRLGTTEFWTAKIAADLASRELVVAASEVSEEPVEVDEPAYEPAYVTDETPADDAPVTHDEEDVNPNESWWVEPEDEPGEEQPDAEEAPEEDKAPARGRLGAFAASRIDDGETSPSEASAETVEEDTEAFLEKVFSELEEPEVEEEGHGLLRRRRIGSMLQDSSED